MAFFVVIGFNTWLPAQIFSVSQSCFEQAKHEFWEQIVQKGKNFGAPFCSSTFCVYMSLVGSSSKYFFFEFFRVSILIHFMHQNLSF